MENKPIIIFTSFSDAINIINQKYLILKIDNKLVSINFEKDNYNIYPVSFNVPENYEKEVVFAGCLLPTLKIVRQLQLDLDFLSFKNRYKEILIERGDKIRSIFKNKNKDIYFIVSLENILGNEFSHRACLYEVLKSEVLKDNVNFLFRNCSIDNKHIKIDESVKATENTELLMSFEGSFSSPVIYTSNFTHSSNPNVQVNGTFFVDMARDGGMIFETDMDLGIEQMIPSVQQIFPSYPPAVLSDPVFITTREIENDSFFDVDD